MLQTDSETMSPIAEHESPPRLRWLERVIVRLLANGGPSSTSQVHRAVLMEQDRVISYNIVDHALRELSRKGVIEREQDGGQYISTLKAEIAVPPPPLAQAEMGWDGTDADSLTAGGYQQIADTGWWEGEPGAGLTVGEHHYQPAQSSASLTLAAVYAWDGRPGYWLATTYGDIIERGAGAMRVIEELLIPAEQGGLLGAAGIVVGRLAAPLTPAHRLKPRLKREAARHARLEFAHLGNLLARYQQHEGISEIQLAQRLWCSFAALDDLSLCLRPERSEESGVAFNRYVRMVADVGGVPAHLLSNVLRDALQIERAEETTG